MGLDLLDIKFNLEREFEIEFDYHSIIELLNNGNTESPPTGAWTDVRVADFVATVEATLANASRDPVPDVAFRTRNRIAESLGIPIEKIGLDSWVIADLGAE